MTSYCTTEAPVAPSGRGVRDAIVVIALSIILVIPASLGALFLLQA